MSDQNNFNAQNNFNGQNNQNNFNGQNDPNNQNNFNAQNNQNNQNNFNAQNNPNNQNNFNGQNNFNNQNNFNGQNNFDSTDFTNEFDPMDIQANKTIGGLAYLLFFLPLLAAPNSKFGKFHANQSLIVFLFAIALGVISGLLDAILPYHLFRILNIVFKLGYLAEVALIIIGLVTALNGKAKELPLIGTIRIIK